MLETFFVHFRASHFSAIQTTRYHYFDTFSTHTHGRGYSHFYSTTVSDFTFHLTSDVVGNNHSI